VESSQINEQRLVLIYRNLSVESLADAFQCPRSDAGGRLWISKQLHYLTGEIFRIIRRRQ
jgi:hypothetical protein